MKKSLLLSFTLLSLFVLTGCETKDTTSSTDVPVTSATYTSSDDSDTNSQSTMVDSDSEILSKLIDYTDAQSPGPTDNYYWDNGKANISIPNDLQSGEYKFTSDVEGRSSTASAILTYRQYEASKGSRQGTPLDPPGWPKNEKTSIKYILTGKTYNGYLWNRSHSIADSLLGVGSYDSEYNFTAGTRSQNVGANQNGGMRYAEELVEDYWTSHEITSATVTYQTTPIYNGSEMIPRGSVVDIKSSDGVLDSEIIVINSAEGNKIDYK